ncbi:MAG TPA: tetratricopeptide repeat protein [Pirellulales bacterium]|nr:tetratricopeptide repeat protein [Pirellulales bacterium]
MKAERRHELQHNVLADQLAVLIEKSRAYSQAIIASVVGVAVLVVVWLYWTNRSTANETAAWSRYVAASDVMTLRRGSLQPLLDVADQYPKTRGGQWARLAAAELQYEQAVQQLFENRTQANEFLASAEQNFTNLRNNSSDRTLQARATLGLARVYEAQNRLEAARLEYDAVITRYPNDVYVIEAKNRRADLDKQATKGFYDWFAKQEITPSSDGTIPGHKPKFEMNTLPPEGPIFEPMGRKPAGTSGATESPASGSETTTSTATPEAKLTPAATSAATAASEAPAAAEPAASNEAPTAKEAPVKDEAPSSKSPE